MTVYYVYKGDSYTSEADAQAAVSPLKTRLESNPTDWMVAQEITGSSETGWSMPSTDLTDTEILNPDSSKYYTAYSQWEGQMYMPLTSAEFSAKVTELRTTYAQYFKVNKIIKVDETDDEETITEIDTTIDMSGYI